MPALALNGVELPVAIDSWRRTEPERLGARGRASSGRAFDSVWGRKWGARCKLAPRSPAESAAWRGLLEGRGDHWTFDSALTSSRGRAHTLVSGTLSAAAGAGPYGGADKYSSATGEAYWPGPATPEWTLLAHAGVPTSGWHRWLIRSDGVRYRNGALYSPGAYDDVGWLTYDSATGRVAQRALSASTTAWAPGTPYSAGNVRKGVLTEGIFKCTAGGTSGGAEPAWDRSAVGALTVDGGATWAFVSLALLRLADLVWLPYAVPDSWVAAVDAEHAARPWTSPWLRATGSFLDVSPRTVCGSVVGSAAVPHSTSSGFEVCGEELDVELREV